MSPGQRQYEFDDVVVQPGAFRVEKSGRPLSLEPKSIRLLLYLIEHRSQAVTKEELLREIWEDVAVTDNALTRVVAQLRRALGDDAKVARYIETIPTLGYRFVAEVIAVAEIHKTSAPAVGGAPVASVATHRSLPILHASWARMAASVLFAFAGLIAGALWQKWRSPEPPEWSGNLLGGPIIASHPRISPDGQMLAFRAIVDGQSQVAIMKPDAASWTVLTHDRSQGSVDSVAWAWDGSRIYFDRERVTRALYSVGPLGGEPQFLLENAGAPEPLPDGSMILMRPSSEGRLQLFRFWPDSGRTEWLPAAVLNSDTRTVRAFPDGKEIAVLGFYGATGHRLLFALDLVSHKVRDLSTPEDFPETSERARFETLAISADGRSVLAMRKRNDSMLLVAVPRDGSKRFRTLMSFPLSAVPLACDAAPDGSIFIDHSARTSAVLNIGPQGNIISETSVPMDTYSILPAPGGGFVFALTRAGKSYLLATAPGAEPRPLLNTAESTRLPGAWLGDGKIVFVIGEGNESRLAIGKVEGGQVLQRFPSDAQHVTAVAASTDGNTVYYASGGILWAQPVSGGDPKNIGAGYDLTADPSGEFLYLMRAGAGGYELLRMPAGGGAAEKIGLPADYILSGTPLSPMAVNRDGRILLPVFTRSEFFYRSAVLDPARHTMAFVPAPPDSIVSYAGWAADNTIEVMVSRWSSTLWRYRVSSKNRR